MIYVNRFDMFGRLFSFLGTAMDWLKNLVTNNLIGALALPTGTTALAFAGYMIYAFSDGHLSDEELKTALNILGVGSGGLATYLGAIMSALKSNEKDKQNERVN